MKVEMLVGDMESQIANYLGFDGMSCCTPLVGGGGKQTINQITGGAVLWLEINNFTTPETYRLP